MSDPSSTIRAWEAAYRRFESPEQEQKKFLRRLIRLGANGWKRDLRICELFCGRGNGLHAWSKLGFTNVEGLDLSQQLAREYRGTAKVIVGDARYLPHADSSIDVISIQGGLHHLHLMEDLILTLREVSRVLNHEGRLVLVEPWSTPFLDLVHLACRNTICRQVSAKIDALSTMIELERETYENWLGRPNEIMTAVCQSFQIERTKVGWGKIMLIGRKLQT